MVLADLEFVEHDAVEAGEFAHTLGHCDLRGGPATGVAEVLARHLPRLDRQRAALQSGFHVVGVERVMRVEVVRLGAGGVHARTLQLLDDQRGAAAGERALRGGVGGLEDGAAEGHTLLEVEGRAVRVDRGVGLAEIARVDQVDFVKAMRAPVGEHLLVRPQRHHAVVLLRIAVPHQHRQVVGDVGVGGGEVLERAHDVGLAEAAVTDCDREEFVAMQVGAGHGEMLALAERAGGSQQAGGRAGEVAQQAVALAEAGAHLGDGVDAHGFQRGIEEHCRIETRRVVADLGHHVAVAQEMQRGDGVGAGGEATGVTRGLAAGDLQREIAQRVGGEQGLVDGRVAGGVGQRGLAGSQERRGAQTVDLGETVGEILDAFAEGGHGLGGGLQLRAHGESFHTMKMFHVM